MANRTKISYKKVTLIISLCLLIAWSAFGAGTSLAWFSDSSSEIKNIVNIAQFDLEVKFRQDDGNYAPIDDRTDIFDNEALYEPGYTQVVYLQVKNNSTVNFDYQTAVIIQDCIIGRNVFGQPLNLLDHLRYGIVTADSEQALDQILSDRSKATEIAVNPLNEYYPAKPLIKGKSEFIALIVQMPTDITNEANYRGLPRPKLKLGISITATQQQ